jgi:acylphosphatase
MNMICLHCYVSGRVQGVFFRHHTQQQAQTLGLTGWVRNLDDGRVEVLICGAPEKTQQMREWLARGPSAAKVTDVVVQEVSWQNLSEFTVK